MQAQTPILQLNVVVIGSGNLAYSLAYAISRSNNKLLEISSRNQANSQQIATLTGAKFVSKIEDITPNAHIYILAVPDGAISEVIKQLPKNKGIIVHTSGSTPIDAISNHSQNSCGIFYPFQTFTFGRIVPFTGIPLCIEASSDETKNTLFALANSIEANPIEMDTEMRKWLHLSGVFACNFVNHILALSHLLATENEIDPALLKPLILETVQKALEGNPADYQTGPAIRGDSETLKRHYVMLSQVDEELRDLYILLSSSIERLNQ
jgi:predicted short-subunit dehydrogenase-like oxidoreductase (DUF2520 family)